MLDSQSKVGSSDRKHEKQENRINQKIEKPATDV
jgi:hypothetical protein